METLIPNKCWTPSRKHSIEEVNFKKNVFEKESELEIAEREEREAMEAMARARAKKAQLTANAHIARLRSERDEVFALEQAKYEAEIVRVSALRDGVIAKRSSLKAGELDAELTAATVARASDFVVTDRQAEAPRRSAVGGVRVRNGKVRPPLVGLIKSRTHFRYKFKGVEHSCWTDTGAVFQDGLSTDTYSTLAEFCDKKIKASGEAGGTTVSVYEKVEAKLNHCPSGDPWRKWGDIYHERTTQIN